MWVSVEFEPPRTAQRRPKLSSFNVTRAGTIRLIGMRWLLRRKAIPGIVVAVGPVVVALCGLAGTLQLTRSLMQRERRQWQHRTDAETVHIAEQVRIGLRERLGPLRGVGLWWQSHGRPLDSEDWQTDLRLFFESGNGLQKVTWIDGAGKRSWSIGRGTLPEER